MSVRKNWQAGGVAPEGTVEGMDGTEGEAPAKDRQFITALARGLEVLRAFEASDPFLGNQEIAQRTGLPKPTVSRITYTLTQLGYLKYLPKFEKYQLGTGVLAFNQAYLASMAVRDVARPHMLELAEATRSTVALGDRDRLTMVYIELQRSVSQVILHQDVGSRIPLGHSAMGWAWLAHAPEALRRQVMDGLKAQDGKEWPSTRKLIQAAEKEIAETGFCVGAGKWLPDINGAGAAFASPDGQSVYAFNLGGPSYVLKEERLREEYGPQLVGMIRAVEADYLRRGFR
jgi:DNA-binding IclR family transcriptional regulator